MSITVTTEGGLVRVIAPYSAAFVEKAKRIGGKWKAKTWVFDTRDEQRVRKLCIEIYGEDGSPTVDRVTLRVTFDARHCVTHGSISIGGRDVARAFGRDSGAKLGDGVVIIEGGFSSGGSVKNWQTTVSKSGATVLIRDMPTEMANRIINDLPSGVIAACIEDESAQISIVDVDALVKEREALLAKIAAIDEALKQARNEGAAQ
ncbi:hypothetical protein CO615_10475 [Lysobacteraceae bacterium NML75-0749]|nr:hypothetical protein CO615_10475 [Xanthomonadaceae bacterium NML75-0749]